MASRLYGAKITGGGSGGTVAVLGRRDAGAAVAEVARNLPKRPGTSRTYLAAHHPEALRLGASWCGMPERHELNSPGGNAPDYEKCGSRP